MFYYLSAAEARESALVTSTNLNSTSFFEKIREAVLTGELKVSFPYAVFLAGIDYTSQEELFAAVEAENALYANSVAFLLSQGYAVEGHVDPLLDNDNEVIGHTACVDISWESPTV